jgi:NADPH:quinone reductase
MESKIWIVEAPGGDFRETTRSHPALGANQVLVKIEASGVNPLDTKIRAGQAPHASSRFPR